MRNNAAHATEGAAQTSRSKHACLLLASGGEALRDGPNKGCGGN